MMQDFDFGKKVQKVITLVHTFFLNYILYKYECCMIKLICVHY